MKFTKEQLEALAAGVDMTTVMSMAKIPNADGTDPEELEAVQALTASLSTVTAEKEALTTQLATALAENEAVKAQMAEQAAASESAATAAATLKSIVVGQITSLSIAAGSKFDASELEGEALVAKHAEMTAAVKNKFANVTIADAAKPGVQGQGQGKKPAVSATRLAKASKFKIVN